MRYLSLVLVIACGHRDASPPPPSPSPPEHAAWRGEPFAVQNVATQPAHFALGDDVSSAVRVPHGWLARRRKDDARTEILDERGTIATIPTPGFTTPSLVVDGDAVYVVVDSAEAPPHVLRLDGRKLVPLAGAFRPSWVFGAVAIGNEGDPRTQHWRTFAIGKTKLAPVEVTQGTDYATGAARVGDDIIVATRDHDPPSGASDVEKANALIASEHGSHAAFAAIIGQANGYLVHLDASGHLVRREPFPDQTPGKLAVTSDGTLVVATEGTARGGFADGVLLARAPGASDFTLVASGLELASDLIAAGSWVCLFTMPGDTRVVHCVDPVRKLHVASEPLRDNINLLGIEPTPAPRVLLRHTWYPGGYGKPVVEDVVALPLP